MPKTDEHTTHIVYFNGGHRSGHTALEVAARFGVENLVLLAPNLPKHSEHEDVRRFRAEVAQHLQVALTYVSPGIGADQFDVALNSLIPGRRFQCATGLKRDPLRDWLKKSASPGHDVVYFGFDRGQRRRIQRRSCDLGLRGFHTDYPLALWDPLTYTSTSDVGIDPPTYDARCIGCLRSDSAHWYQVFKEHGKVWKRAKSFEDKVDEAILPHVFLEEIEADFEELHRLDGTLVSDGDSLPCECTT